MSVYGGSISEIFLGTFDYDDGSGQSGHNGDFCYCAGNFIAVLGSIGVDF